MCGGPHGAAWCTAAYAQTAAFKGTDDWRTRKAKLLTFPQLTLGALEQAGGDAPTCELLCMLAAECAPSMEPSSIPIALLVPTVDELMQIELFGGKDE